VKEALNLQTKITDKVSQKIKKDVVRECTKIKERLNRASRIEERFLDNNEAWLDESVSFALAEEDTSEDEPMKSESGKPNF